MTEHHITLSLGASAVLQLQQRRQELAAQGHDVTLSEVAKIIILEVLMVEYQYRQADERMSYRYSALPCDCERQQQAHLVQKQGMDI